MTSNKSKHRKDEDNISIGGCSIGRSTDFSLDTNFDSGQMSTRLVKFGSVIYAIFVIVLGAVICVKDLSSEVSDRNHLFIIITTLIGFVWIGFLHWDIQKYKRWAIQFLKPDKQSTKDNFDNKSLNSEFDSISISTAVIFNTYQKPIPDDANASTVSPFESAYRFLHGKHSGNFYLKCGMTGMSAFTFVIVVGFKFALPISVE